MNYSIPSKGGKIEFRIQAKICFILELLILITFITTKITQISRFILEICESLMNPERDTLLFFTGNQ